MSDEESKVLPNVSLARSDVRITDDVKLIVKTSSLGLYTLFLRTEERLNKIKTLHC